MTRREEIARRFSEYQTVYGVLTDDDREFFKEVSAILTLPPLPVEPGEAKDFAERLLFLDGKISPSGAKGLCAEASAFITAQAAEIERVQALTRMGFHEKHAELSARAETAERRIERLLHERNEWKRMSGENAKAADDAERKLAEARKVLVEAMTKVENDRTLYTPEWQMWLADARAALTEKDQDHG
jgi:hypothetical protein